MQQIATLINQVQMAAPGVPTNVAHYALRQSARRFCQWTHALQITVALDPQSYWGFLQFYTHPAAGDTITVGEVELVAGTDFVIAAQLETTLNNVVAALVADDQPAVRIQNRVWVSSDSTEVVEVFVEFTAGGHVDTQDIIPGVLRTPLEDLPGLSVLKVVEISIDSQVLGTAEYSFETDGRVPLRGLSASADRAQIVLSMIPDTAPVTDLFPDIFVTGQYSEAVIAGALSSLMSSPRRPYTDLMAARLHGQEFQRGVARARHLADTHNASQDARFHT